MGLITFSTERFNVGVIADVGARSAMEDTYLIVNDLGIEEFMKISMYAIIDGHGGDWCAHYIRKRLPNELRKQLDDPILGFKNCKDVSINECITNVFKRTFKEIDEGYYIDMKDVAQKCGAAVCVVLIIGNRIFSANVGDSRAVLCRSGQALNLSNDHKTVRKYIPNTVLDKTRRDRESKASRRNDSGRESHE